MRALAIATGSHTIPTSRRCATNVAATHQNGDRSFCGLHHLPARRAESSLFVRMHAGGAFNPGTGVSDPDGAGWPGEAAAARQYDGLSARVHDLPIEHGQRALHVPGLVGRDLVRIAVPHREVRVTVCPRTRPGSSGRASRSSQARGSMRNRWARSLHPAGLDDCWRTMRSRWIVLTPSASWTMPQR